jgi:hypothetical protein
MGKTKVYLLIKFIVVLDITTNRFLQQNKAILENVLPYIYYFLYANCFLFFKQMFQNHLSQLILCFRRPNLLNYYFMN